MYHEAADSTDQIQRTQLAKWATQSEKNERIAAMLKLARSEPGIPVLPDRLDADPWKLNCLDGVIDLKTGNLLAHDRKLLCTKICPTEYGNEAGIDSPLWAEFLNQTFAGNEGMIRFLQRLLGYSLVGAVYEHCLPVWYGTGANGKSVLVETMLGVIGPDYACKAASDLLLVRRNDAHPCERADLFGVRLAVCTESDDGRRLAESVVKELSGGDSIKARRMRENLWQFRPSHLAVLVTNHKPTVRGTDNGIWRRLLLLQFGVTIPPDQQDKSLVEKLLAERTGILRWLVAGCLAWHVLGQFIDERCQVNDLLNTKASDLYDAYADWAKKAGEHTHSKRRFGMAMTERGFERYTNNGVWYRGIGIQQEF
jgi:putative DNA primase/helicase